MKSQQILAQNKLTNEDFNWTGNDLLIDFYRFRSADELAFADVSERRTAAYKVLAKLFLDTKDDVSKPLQKQMKLFFSILEKFMHEVPADHFTVNLHTGEINRKER